MKFKPVYLSMLVLLLITTLVAAGCTLKAAPDAEMPEITDEADLMEQMAEENTEGMETPSPEATEPAPGETEPPSEEATEAPTEEASEPTPVETLEPTPTPAPELPTPVPTEEGPLGGTVEPVVTGPRTHVVQPGQNLFRIAMQYRVPVETLAQANSITNPALIYVGQTLTIPSPGTTPPSPGPAPSPGGGGVHTVQPGENLFRIALKYNYNYLYLAQYNGISNPNLVYVGQKINIP